MNRQPSQLTANGTVDVGEVVAAVRPHTAWPTAEAALEWWQHHGSAIVQRKQQASSKPCPDSASRPPTVDASCHTDLPESNDDENSESPSKRDASIDGSAANFEAANGAVSMSQSTSSSQLSNIQLRLEASLAAASRVEVLDTADAPIMRFCSTGASLDLATSAAPGTSVEKISEDRPPENGEDGFSTPKKHRRNLSGIASAAATPNSLRQVTASVVLAHNVACVRVLTSLTAALKCTIAFPRALMALLSRVQSLTQ